MRPTALLSTLLIGLTTACANKQASTNAQTEASSSRSRVATQAPDDSNSQQFVQTLLSMNIDGFSPVDSGGAKLVYNSFQFQSDNTWVASGYVEIIDERMECVENGTWSMEPATAPNVAKMVWVISQTDCPSREVDTRSQLLVTLSDNRIRVERR